MLLLLEFLHYTNSIVSLSNCPETGHMIQACNGPYQVVYQQWGSHFVTPFLLCSRVSYMFADFYRLFAGCYSARQICYHYDEQWCCTWGWISAVRFVIHLYCTASALCLSFHFTLIFPEIPFSQTTFFSPLGGDSQMNELIWYSWLGGVIIGTMIGANSVLEEHCKAGPRNVVITGR